MTGNEAIKNEKYHTCGRCKYEYTLDNEYPCKDCIRGIDFRKDLWEYNEESGIQMETVELVIKLTNYDYNYVLSQGDTRGPSFAEAIKNGTVLPKGHDDLIERAQVTNYDNLYDVPTVIKADKENKE